jgi:ferredoxin
MEMDQFPDRIWVVSHKPVAVAAGLGHMGIHRNVIHPKFGNFILLATVLMDHELTVESGQQSQPVDFNPCLECKLCVAACPVGAISPAGDFDFSACYTHNYREFMGGFTDWAEQLAASASRNGYRSRFTDAESASMWASLSFGANYKAAYCLAVCPAGEDVISPWIDDKQRFIDDTLRPLQNKVENIYVVPGSDAEAHVQKRFPHKAVRRVRGSLHPTSIDFFLKYMRLQFQPGQSKGLTATWHFTFTGAEQRLATVRIADQQLHVEDGHQGTANLHITADSRTWLRFLKREVSLLRALLTLKIRLWGSPLWLVKFGKCFPS